MSIPPNVLPFSFVFDQFIRPNAVHFDSTATRLTSRAEGFTGSVEFAEAISGGFTTELADKVMVALGHHFNTLGSKDMCALVDLYTTVPSMQKDADEAFRSPALSFSQTRSIKDPLSSLENDTSLNGTPSL